MKKKRTLFIGIAVIIIIAILILIAVLMSKSKHKNPLNTPKTKEEIKQNYKYFDISLDYNGIQYRVIKTSKGYYYENKKINDYVYYDMDENRSYTIENNVKYEEETNYDFSKKINTIYDVLTFHVDRNNFPNLLKENISYLNREVTKYYRDSSELIEETYYIDEQTGACLYFSLNDGTSRVLCKIDALTIGDQSLEQFKEYEILKKVDLSKIKKADEIKNNFVNYNISFYINEDLYQIISTNEGLYFKTTDVENLYIVSEDQWYIVSSESKTKTPVNIKKTKEEIEQIILNQITSHIYAIDDKFYVSENKDYIGRKVDIYVKTTRSSDSIYRQKYYIDIETGACLNKEVSNSRFTIVHYQQNASIEEMINYETKPQISFDEWPSEHPYVLGIKEIEYGTFYQANVFDGDLYIFYQNINNNNYVNIKEYFKEIGFTTIDENQVETDQVKLFQATREDGLQVRIEFLVSEMELTIIFCQI